MNSRIPLVSIVTPVYNGEKYLAECIESVLAQTYNNWDYTIINNCSTDKSLEIAQGFADQDPRIKVNSNKHFVEAIENHNIAFRSISPDSKYCKLVSADDWIYPGCVSMLVDIAERYPNVGLVGSYSISKNGIHNNGLPHKIQIFDGRHVCRLFLLGLLDTFWLPSTVLYRSSLVRADHAFFPGSAPSADLAACLNCLKTSDFGFVHQILAFERIHDESWSARVREVDSYLLDRIAILKDFGPSILSHQEFSERMEALLCDYYNMLAASCVNFRNRDFWRLHKERLKELGYSLYDRRLTRAVCKKLSDLFFNPKQTIEKIQRRVVTNRTPHSQKCNKSDYSAQ
jgi:glycosyltransferase involved in cell wall biosynthesis